MRRQETGDEKIRSERERERVSERGKKIARSRNRKRARKPESSSSLLPYPFDPSDGIPPCPMGLPAASINKLQLLRFSLPQFPSAIPPASPILSLIPRNGTDGKRFEGGKRYFPDNTLSLFLSLSLLLSALGPGNRSNPHRSVK